jgi:hypothetical protein
VSQGSSDYLWWRGWKVCAQLLHSDDEISIIIASDYRTIGTSICIHVELHTIHISHPGHAMPKGKATFPSSPSSDWPTKVAVEERSLSRVTPTPSSVELHQSCLLDHSFCPSQDCKGLSLLPRLSSDDVYKCFILVPTFLNFSSFFIACLFTNLSAYKQVPGSGRKRVLAR